MWRCVRRPSTSRSPHCGCPQCPWRGYWRVFLDARWIIRALSVWRKPARPSSRCFSCCGCGGSGTRTRTSSTASYEVRWHRRFRGIGCCIWMLLLTTVSLQGCTTARGKSPAATAWKTWPWTTSWSSPRACRGSKFVRRTSWLWFRPASPGSTSCSCFTSGRRWTMT